jgi:2-haloacid dehalogenase
MDKAPSHLHAVALDLYGTLLDIGTLAAEVDAAAGAGTLQKWRAAQLRRTWELNAKGDYQPFDQVTAEALLEVAPHLPERARIKLCELWLTLPAHPDAVPALRQLNARGMKVGVLSNGTVAMIRAALGAAGLTVDFVFSADQVKQYKPDSQVYACSISWVRPGRRSSSRRTAGTPRGRRSATVWLRFWSGEMQVRIWSRISARLA